MSAPAAGLDAGHIVVRTPNWLGDTVMAQPMLAALRAAAGEARITLVGRWAPLLAGQGVADVLLGYPRPLRARRRLARALAAEPPDVAVLLPSSLEAALAAVCWRARRRVGYATDGRTPLLTDAMALPEPRRHQVDEYAELLALLGVTGVAATPRWILPDDPDADAEVARLLTEAGLDPRAPLVGLHLGAAFGSSKLWPPAAFGHLARALATVGLCPVLLGTEDDAPTAAAVADAAGVPVASLVGRDRPALLARLLGRLRCLVSGDTGVAHLAAAVGVPTVTLFGPTDRRLTAPRGPGARALDRPVPCAPCFLPTCPIDHVCLTRLPPEAVLDEVRLAVA
ncbi:MAG TPA: lipopolysaccharide heptosyltransferase II [Methylomirabilota bacterium]|nr:lipopolysaccharide heptosyltransferase II [Methylomirabilota bacterium]